MAAKRLSGKKGITIRDVIVHMQHMEQRLLKGIGESTSGIVANTIAIRNVEKRLANVETELIETREHLTARINALDEDLTATIRDAVKIRRHVGMAVPDEE